MCISREFSVETTCTLWCWEDLLKTVLQCKAQAAAVPAVPPLKEVELHTRVDAHLRLGTSSWNGRLQVQIALDGLPSCRSHALIAASESVF